MIVALLAGSGYWSPARASFHFWDITEVYSNADGSVQFIEMFTSFNNQHVMNGRVMTATSDGNVLMFVLDSDLPGSTTNRSLLFATAGFGALPGGVTPDYVIPTSFLDPTATNISIDFAGVDTFNFTGANLPTDGIDSLLRDLSTTTNSPTNYSGEAGSLTEPPIFANGFE